MINEAIKRNFLQWVYEAIGIITKDSSRVFPQEQSRLYTNSNYKYFAWDSRAEKLQVHIKLTQVSDPCTPVNLCVNDSTT